MLNSVLRISVISPCTTRAVIGGGAIRNLSLSSAALEKIGNSFNMKGGRVILRKSIL